MKMETTKPSEEKEKKNKTCAISFSQNIGLNLDRCSYFLMVLWSSTLLLWSP